MTYQKFATDVALALGASQDRAVADVSEMIDFEIQLANVRLYVTESVIVQVVIVYSFWQQL